MVSVERGAKKQTAVKSEDGVDGERNGDKAGSCHHIKFLDHGEYCIRPDILTPQTMTKYPNTIKIDRGSASGEFWLGPFINLAAGPLPNWTAGLCSDITGPQAIKKPEKPEMLGAERNYPVVGLRREAETGKAQEKKTRKPKHWRR